MWIIHLFGVASLAATFPFTGLWFANLFIYLKSNYILGPSTYELPALRINYTPPIDILKNDQCRAQSIAKKTWCVQPGDFAEKPIPSYLHYFVSSIYLCVCMRMLPLLWRMINISVKCHFGSRSVYFPCLVQGFEISCLLCLHPYRSMCIHAPQWSYMYEHTLTLMRQEHFSPPQLTQLGQQIAPHNSPNYPAAPCLFQLPQRAMLIYNRTYVAGSSNVHRHTHKFHSTEKHAFLHMCPSCWWLPSS